MSAATTKRRDAVIYLPGLFGAGDITVDAVARRIAVAFDRNQATGTAKFSISEGNEFAFEGSSRTRLITVQRHDGGGPAMPFIDVYQLDYRDTLREIYLGRAPARQVISIFWLLAGLLLRFLAAVRQKSKSPGEKFQVAAAGGVFLLISVYLVMLIATAAATALHLAGILPGAAPATDGGSTAAGVDWIARKIADLLPWAQSAIVILTGLGLFTRQGIKQFVTDTAVDYASGLDYLSTDRKKPTLIGQFAGLLETIAESDTDYDKIHVIGFSFGSIVAIDCIFQTSAPTPRFGRIDSLITVGSPFDIIRTFWPDYFKARKRSPGQMKWINVFSRNDVLSSNFSNEADPAIEKPEFGMGDKSNRLLPNNVHFGGSATRQMNLLERMNRARHLHIEYWGGSDFAKSFLYQIVPDVWAGHAALE